MRFQKVAFAATLFSALGFVRSVNSEECLNGDTSAQECQQATTPDADACQTNVHHGLCVSNQEDMFKHCASQCIQNEDFGVHGYFSNNSIHAVSDMCADSHEDCLELAQDSECNLNPNYMLKTCAKSCRACFEKGDRTFEIGVRQTISKEAENNTEKVQQFLQTIQATNKYMAETVMVEKEYTQVRQFCFNTDKLCTVRAMEGDCRKPDDYEALEDGDEDLVKYEYMASNCSPTCQICDLLILTNEEVEILNECTPDVETNVFQEGDLNKMFQRIVGELPFEDGAVVPDYKVNIISRPLSEEHIGSAMHELDFHVGPWILTLDNFLTDDECDRLVELGATSGYYKSLIENEDEDEEDEEEEEEDAYRTSTNAWCQDECYKDPIAQRVIQKIENTTGIPDSYSEYLQLLKYVPGQYYKEHHDWSYDTYHRKYHNPGPRLVTFFLYLNEVEEGGATRFTDIFADDTAIHIDVKPKKGTALVWPSVHDEDLNKLDERTYHAALSVEKGLKFGANAWLHLRDFKNDECDYEEMESITGRRKNVDEDEE